MPKVSFCAAGMRGTPPLSRSACTGVPPCWCAPPATCTVECAILDDMAAHVPVYGKCAVDHAGSGEHHLTAAGCRPHEKEYDARTTYRGSGSRSGKRTA